MDLCFEGSRSPFRIEYNPWLRDEHLEEILFLRGAIVSAMGELETSFTEITLRISTLPEYHAVREKFPSRRDARIAFLRNAVSVDGPLKKYGRPLELFLLRYEVFLDLRDTVAHARMRANSAQDQVRITFSDYYAADGGANLKTRVTTLPRLRGQARRLSRLSRYFNALFASVEKELPQLRFAK